MSSTPTTAGPIDALNDEQRLAAGARTTNIFIEAGPGTGKTTVSAQRFGMQRFAPGYLRDRRAVVAVSFTRAATYNLRRRVQRLWGTSALAWPHRIITLDTIMCDLVHDLLHAGLLVWPNQVALWPDGQIHLDVHDSLGLVRRQHLEPNHLHGQGGRPTGTGPSSFPAQTNLIHPGY